jgi:hypothetical protein
MQYSGYLAATIKKGGVLMRKYTHIIIVVVPVFLCIFAMGVSAQKDEILKGSWENGKYTKGVWKLVIHADGSYEAFKKVQDSRDTIKGNCKIVEKWTDCEGCLCYKTVFEMGKGKKSYGLMKINATGKMLEYVEDPREFPVMFSPEAYTYRKLFRK